MAVGEAPSLTLESARKCSRNKQATHTVPSLASPPQAVSQHSKEGCPSQANTSGSTPSQPISCAKTKKYGPNERTEQTSGKELSDEEIANLSDGELKALVIKMLTDLIELGQKMKKTNEGYPK